MPYVPHTPEERQAMLSTIGVNSVEELFAPIDASLRPQHFDLPEGLSEMAVTRRLEELAARNSIHLHHFLGAGFYDHAVPAAVNALSGRGEFYTAYTPYQPEASQGILQAFFEFQTAIARLFEMDFANASLYDGGTALYEAVMTAVRVTKRRKVVVSEAVNPIYRSMLDCYTSNLNLELVTIPHTDGKTDLERLTAAIDDQTAAIIVQNPNFFGAINDFTELFATAQKHKALSILSTYPLLQSVLKTPGAMGADIAVAEGQSLGLPLAFGGPYLGVFACRKKLVRQMPGRVVGRTKDADGKTGYTLTLQTREQHIRRQKATSNICSNQALCALQAIIYMSLLGPEGMTRTASTSIERAHYAAQRFCALPGVEMVNTAPFGNEFAVRLPCKAYDLINRLLPKGYVPGFPLGRYYENMDDCLLVAVTEKTEPADIGIMAEMVGGAL
ncbi:aminomethyl-transferring glycine dehydrogenase subunit GcvPA [Desulfohalobium retbaense]|uniref:Probable glycine dehydrogenase (decarboxylating) subunit 1 n=1 Tax=Desulfohalobium retbaense (strain ATCC 49708 / DSM 5692 / JCM 16813 / HR100) TaxID=485915 RepID=C8X365_DESRD|nr:aminomethyl-transferring glycine dehydrogenase subunit GcvPA [Desulfohalobium retbaense]ACV68862.1 Glycine dehydrogenase (decarboxylating) [Desulfohalobium retbaense DSM 5692]